MKAIATTMMVAGAAAVGSQADLLAYDGFVGTEDAQILGTSGGSGTATWESAAWAAQSGTGESWVFKNGLSYTDGSNTLVTSGLGATNTTLDDNGGNRAIIREFGPQDSTSTGGNLWVSFLLERQNDNNGSVGVSLFNGGSERNFLGALRNIGDTDYAAVGPMFTSSGNGSSGVSGNLATHLYVAHFDFTAGTATLWLDPTIGGAGPTGGTSWSRSFSGSEAFDRVRLGAFNGGSVVIDELRVATTYSEAVPVPEPASLALLGLGGLALVARRRH